MKNSAKFFARLAIATGLIIYLSAFFGAQTVFAITQYVAPGNEGIGSSEHAPIPVEPPPPPPPGPTPPTPPAIPDTFNVNEHLKLPGQTSLVPKNATEAAADDKGIVGVIIKAIDLLVKITASLALLIFMIGALLTMVSEGKEDRLEKGKNAMVYSLIGLVISGFAFIIVAFVQSILFQ